MASTDDTSTGSRDHDKRQRDEPQRSHAEHVLLIRAAVAELKVRRGVRNNLLMKEKRHSQEWCRQPAHKAEKASGHAKVDESLTQIALLCEGIDMASLDPPLLDSQWQPSAAERKRVQLANILNPSAVASGHSTRQSTTGALKQLGTSIRIPRLASAFTREQRERYNAVRVEKKSLQQAHDAYDNAYVPGSSFCPQEHPRRHAQQQRLSQVDSLVFDCSTTWNDTKHFLDLLHTGRLAEFDKTNDGMRKYFEIVDGGVDGVCAVWNVGANPAFFRSTAFIQRAVLSRIRTAIAFMVIHPLCMSTALCSARPCGCAKIDSFRRQVWNPKLLLLVMIEFPRSAEVNVSVRMRGCVRWMGEFVIMDPLTSRCQFTATHGHSARQIVRAARPSMELNSIWGRNVCCSVTRRRGRDHETHRILTLRKTTRSIRICIPWLLLFFFFSFLLFSFAFVHRGFSFPFSFPFCFPFSFFRSHLYTVVSLFLSLFLAVLLSFCFVRIGIPWFLFSFLFCLLLVSLGCLLALSVACCLSGYLA